MNDWWVSNSDRLVGLIGAHLALAAASMAVASVLSLPIGLVLSGRVTARRAVPSRVTGYTLPVLALLVLLYAFVGGDRLPNAGIVAALALPTTVLLTRRVVAAVRDLPGEVRRGAVGIGYGTLRRRLFVELPLAAPALFAGIRAAAVANVSLATLAALVGGGGLGTLFLEAFREDFLAPAVTGLVLVLTLTLLAERGVRGLQWLAVPWARGATSS